MPFVKHVFRAKSRPTPKELHCLWATLTDKAHVNDSDAVYRISTNHKLVSIVCDEGIPSVTVELDTNAFVPLRAEPVMVTAIQPGQMVRVQGALAYSIHDTKTNKDLCPVDALGQLKAQGRGHFLAYLSKQLGLDVATAFKDGQATFSWDDWSEPDDKVWLNDVILVDVIGTVIDAERLNQLPVRAIGRRKSYGAGAFSVVEVAASEVPD
jgi:hypothetical protein